MADHNAGDYNNDTLEIYQSVDPFGREVYVDQEVIYRPCQLSKIPIFSFQLFDDFVKTGLEVGGYRSDESTIIFSMDNLYVTGLLGFTTGCIIRGKYPVTLQSEWYQESLRTVQETYQKTTFAEYNADHGVFE